MVPPFFYATHYDSHRTFNRRRTSPARTIRHLVILPKDICKVLPWVHIAISNAKSTFTNIYHGIKKEFLQYADYILKKQVERIKEIE